MTRLSSILAPAAALLMTTMLLGQESDQEEVEGRASAQRLELMRELAHQFSAQPLDEEAGEHLDLQSEPIMRYNDPARGLGDGSVWRLRESGRPHALVAVELRPREGRYLASFELLAVEMPTYRATFRRFTWEPPRGFAEFQPIADGPSPAGTDRARLTQMKQLARRFGAQQQLGGVNYALRMLPQPIDRYQPSEDAGADGAAFAFTYGVNPEVLLLIETDSAGWQFACLRLSVARLFVDFDGERAWTANPTGEFEYQNSHEVYTNLSHSVPLPAAEIE